MKYEAVVFKMNEAEFKKFVNQAKKNIKPILNDAYANHRLRIPWLTRAYSELNVNCHKFQIQNQLLFVLIEFADHRFFTHSLRLMKSNEPEPGFLKNLMLQTNMNGENILMVAMRKFRDSNNEKQARQYDYIINEILHPMYLNKIEQSSLLYQCAESPYQYLYDFYNKLEAGENNELSDLKKLHIMSTLDDLQRLGARQTREGLAARILNQATSLTSEEDKENAIKSIVDSSNHQSESLLYIIIESKNARAFEYAYSNNKITNIPITLFSQALNLSAENSELQTKILLNKIVQIQAPAAGDVETNMSSDESKELNTDYIEFCNIVSNMNDPALFKQILGHDKGQNFVQGWLAAIAAIASDTPQTREDMWREIKEDNEHLHRPSTSSIENMLQTLVSVNDYESCVLLLEQSNFQRIPYMAFVFNEIAQEIGDKELIDRFEKSGLTKDSVKQNQSKPIDGVLHFNASRFQIIANKALESGNNKDSESFYQAIKEHPNEIAAKGHEKSWIEKALENENLDLANGIAKSTVEAFQKQLPDENKAAEHILNSLDIGADKAKYINYAKINLVIEHVNDMQLLKAIFNKLSSPEYDHLREEQGLFRKYKGHGKTTTWRSIAQCVQDKSQALDPDYASQDNKFAKELSSIRSIQMTRLQPEHEDEIDVSKLKQPKHKK